MLCVGLRPQGLFHVHIVMSIGTVLIHVESLLVWFTMRLYVPEYAIYLGQYSLCQMTSWCQLKKKNVLPLCLGFQVRVSLYSPWLSWNSLLDQAGFRLSDPLVSASFALGLKVWSNLVSWSFIDSELILQVVRASQHNFGIKLGGYWKIHVKHSFNFTCVIKQLQAKHMF